MGHIGELEAVCELRAVYIRKIDKGLGIGYLHRLSTPGFPDASFNPRFPTALPSLARPP